jgi:hypothetical protein
MHDQCGEHDDKRGKGLGKYTLLAETVKLGHRSQVLQRSDLQLSTPWIPEARRKNLMLSGRATSPATDPFLFGLLMTLCSNNTAFCLHIKSG